MACGGTYSNYASIPLKPVTAAYSDGTGINLIYFNMPPTFGLVTPEQELLITCLPIPPPLTALLWVLCL